MTTKYFSLEYWLMNEETGKYLHKVETLKKKHGVTNIQGIAALNRENESGRLTGTCKFCSQDFYAYSRYKFSHNSRDKVQSCGHIGFCRACNSEPITKSNIRGVCLDCNEMYNETLNKAQKELEDNAELDHFSETEIKALSYIEENPDCLFVNNIFNLKKLSLALKLSANKTETVCNNLLKKGGISAEYEGNSRFIKGVNANFELPPFFQEIHCNIIPSLEHRAIFNVLKKRFNTFVQVPFAAFFDFDYIADQLNESDKYPFFNKRLNFVCCDEDFEVVALIEFNSYKQFTASKESRRFKLRIAEILGLPLIEIDSHKQLEDALHELLDK